MPGQNTSVRIEELQGLAAFDWLSAPRLAMLGRHMTELGLRKGEVLYRPGQAAKHIYCVLAGTIDLSLLGSDGRIVELALLTRGEFFGPTALVRDWQRVSQAIALEDSRVGRIEARTLVTGVFGLPWDIFTGVTQMVLKPLLTLSLRRCLFLTEELSDRVALALWEYAGHPEPRRARGLLPSRLTHEHLAALVGASRPRVSLALKRLEGEGVFVREGKQIRVQRTRLHAFLEKKYSFLLDDT